MANYQTNKEKYEPRVEEGFRRNQKCIICRFEIRKNIKRYKFSIPGRHIRQDSFAICPICFNKLNKQLNVKEMEDWTLELGAKAL